MHIKNYKKESLNFPNSKQNNNNHERNKTNFQMDNINNKNFDFSDEIKDLRERENKMNGLKNEINNPKFKSIINSKHDRRKRGQYFSEPNLDIEKIINNQNSLPNNNDIEKNFDNEKLIQVSPINQNKEEIIDFENDYSNKNNNNNDKDNYYQNDYKGEISENKYLNDNPLTNLSNIKKMENNISEELDEINNTNKENQDEKNYGYIKKIKNINPNLNNKTALKNEQPILENGSNKEQDIINKLKIENVNLKAKIGILRVSLEKKDKIIQSLINKNNELEKYTNNNNNKDENENYEKTQNKINSLKIEKNILFNKNKNLILGIESLNERIKEINIMIENQKMMFDREQFNNKKKLVEYRKKIILLKRRINELYLSNIYRTNNTYSNDNIIRKYSYLKNQNNILFKTYKRKDFIDSKDKYTHHRFNTFIKDYKYYLENI